MPSSNETINITSLDIKPHNSRTTPASIKLISPAASTATNTTSNITAYRNTLTYSLNKDSTLPVISFNKPTVSVPTRETVLRNRSELANLNRSIDNQPTGYLLKLNDTKTTPFRHSVNDVRVRGKEMRPVGINEPKLFEFRHYQVPVNKININRPFFIKRTSAPYQQFVKLSKARSTGNSDVYSYHLFSISIVFHLRREIRRTM